MAPIKQKTLFLFLTFQPWAFFFLIFQIWSRDDVQLYTVETKTIHTSPDLETKMAVIEMFLDINIKRVSAFKMIFIFN